MKLHLVAVSEFEGYPFARPTAMVFAPGSSRTFVAEQDGRLLELLEEGGQFRLSDFLGLTSVVSSLSFEDGLLGLAFHPKFQENGLLFLSYTADNPLRLVVAKYSVTGQVHSTLDLVSGVPILEIPKLTPIHNGGQIDFGPEGYLYISVGDSDEQGNPEGTAQAPGSPLGAILRIDVDRPSEDRPYGIPADNPFADGQGHLPEVWAFGFRNPWRFSFDPKMGRLFVADVGQYKWEEINVVDAGKNYGWNVMEGPECFLEADCDKSPYEAPVWAYDHEAGDCAIIGGAVYQGGKLPALEGTYLFGDFCSGRVWGLEFAAEGPRAKLLASTGLALNAFALDGEGNVYVLSYASGIFRLIPASEKIAVW